MSESRLEYLLEKLDDVWNTYGPEKAGKGWGPASGFHGQLLAPHAPSTPTGCEEGLPLAGAGPGEACSTTTASTRRPASSMTRTTGAGEVSDRGTSSTCWLG